MAKRITVRVKSDPRGENWAAETAQRMHAVLASKADRSTAQRESRKAARAEKRNSAAADAYDSSRDETWSRGQFD